MIELDKNDEIVLLDFYCYLVDQGIAKEGYNGKKVIERFVANMISGGKNNEIKNKNR